MLFVADRVQKELARIVEFLNEQMRPAEVLAIEVEQFVSASGARTLVPRLVGATERARTAKAIGSDKQILTEQEWLAALGDDAGRDGHEGAELAVRWFRENGFEISMSKTQAYLSVSTVCADGKLAWPFFLCRSTGRMELSLGTLADTPQFEDDTARLALLERLKAIPASSLKASNKLKGWPSIELRELLNDSIWTAMQELAGDLKRRLQE